MAILTDGVHLVSDKGEEELHAFAQRMGLKRRWFQGDHYDLLGRQPARAIAAGAVKVGRRRIAQVARRRKHGDPD